MANHRPLPLGGHLRGPADLSGRPIRIGGGYFQQGPLAIADVDLPLGRRRRSLAPASNQEVVGGGDE